MLRRYLLVWIFFLVGCSSAGRTEPEGGLVRQIPSPNLPAGENQSRIISNSSTPGSDEALRLTSLGPAPELTNDVWINSPEPLRLADLHGKVILLEMWTFG